MVRVPTDRKPTHPGTVLLHEVLRQLELTQRDLGNAPDVPFQRVNEIVRGKGGVTQSATLRIAKVLGTSPDVWMNLQQRWDLYRRQKAGAEYITNIRPLEAALSL